MPISQDCTLIAVVGGKGGIGKSVFTANFAGALLQELRQSVLVIDADARSAGDQNVLLGLRPNKTLKEVSEYSGSFTAQSLPQLITPHGSGIHFIGAVRGPEESLQASPDLVSKSLEFLSRNYKYIVVDVGSDLQPLQLALLMEATAIVVVTSPDVLVINQTQRVIQDLLSNTFRAEMLQLVVNRFSNGGIPLQTIGQTLRMPVLTAIPQDDVTVSASIQKGSPFIFLPNRPPVAAAYTDLVRKLTGGIFQRLKSLSRPQPLAPTTTTNSEGVAVVVNGVDARNALKIRIHNELIKAMDLKKGITETGNDPAKENLLRKKTKETLTKIVDTQAPSLSTDERARMIKEVLEEALGLGPLEDLLADPAVTEIMVNGHKKIYLEKSGRVQRSEVTFTSNMHLRNVIERIVTPLGRVINDTTPYVDARLKDGSRVNAVIEPLSIDGPAVTIRKFKKGGITAEKYLEYGSMTRSMIDFVKICSENGLNIVISGGTGSGKTSLLNMLSTFIPVHERIITVEDAAELQMQQDHVVRLESKPAGMDGKGAVTIRDLIRNALRMRPDRIVVGECRDGAALDMLQAMNTGHDGSMTTTHANSPRECIARLETLCMMAGMDLPLKAIREQIAGAVNLIIQISRLPDGSRKILNITEVGKLRGEMIELQDIFVFKETGFDKNGKIIGQFQSTGLIPTFIEKLEQKGVRIPRDIFTTESKPATPIAAAPKPAPSQAAAAMNPALKKTGTGGR